MNNYGKTVVGDGTLRMVAGLACVPMVGKLPQTGDVPAAEFLTLTGNDPAFIREWANNRYPMQCNGWVIEPVASHIGTPADDTYAVTFIVNNAVLDDDAMEELGDATYGVYQISLEDGEVKTELTPIISVVPNNA